MTGRRAILVVNDDPLQQRLLSGLLEAHGYRVRTTGRAREGLAILREDAGIGGIITDLNMPELDGWSFCRMLRSPEYQDLARLPVLVVSATFSGEDALTVTSELGAHAFLAAPFDPAALLREVGAMMGGRSSAAALRALIAHPPGPPRDRLVAGFEAHGYVVAIAGSAEEVGRHALADPAGVVVAAFGLHEPFLPLPQLGAIIVVIGVPPGSGHALALTRSGVDALTGEEREPDYVIAICERARRQRALLRVQELLEDRTRRLRDSEERLTAVLSSIPDVILVLNREWRIQHANPAAGRAFGTEPARLVGRDARDFGERAEESRGPRAFSALLRREGEEPLEFEATTRAIRYGGGAAILVVARDVTERRRAERQMALLAQVVEQAGEMFAVTGPEQRIEYVNSAFERMTGYTRDEARGAPLAMLRSGSEADAEHYALIDRAIGEGRSWRGRLRRRRKDGTLYTSEGAFSPVRDGSGRIVRLVAVERDVTQELEMEHALRQAVKMEAIGTLAGGIAHDFNNLLTSILGYGDLILSGAAAGSEVAQLAEVIVTSAGRASELTGQLLGFARRGKNRNVPLDVNETVRGVVKLLSRTLDKEIRLETSLLASPATVTGDPTQLDQVLLNLALNARDALAGRGGGRIEFSTANFRMEEEYCARNPGAVPGETIALLIRDTGCGIPAAIISRIFEPFFTTKPPGQGSGMGLSMVYGIVKNHGGTVRVQSEENVGTTFSLYLPASQTVAPEANEAVPDAPVRGTGRILVVDDEAVVRETAGAMLRRLGYDVITAADGEEAVVYYRTFGRKVDLVLLDMVMPRMGGRACFRELKRINPEVRAILSTGYGLNEAAQQILDEGAVGFIKKPFRIAAFSQAVAEAMRGVPSEAGQA